MARASSWSRAHGDPLPHAVGGRRPDEGDGGVALGGALEARQERSHDGFDPRGDYGVTACRRVAEEPGAGQGRVGAVRPGLGERLGVVVAAEGDDAGVGEHASQVGHCVGVAAEVDDDEVGAGAVVGGPTRSSRHRGGTDL